MCGVEWILKYDELAIIIFQNIYKKIILFLLDKRENGISQMPLTVKLFVL